ncbi:MAG TPA: metallophosphoesterase [Methanoregulaceae archaeon]|nr:MAG: metallophosphoesterase [Methanolinea sp.]HON80833.1 metallophosphoesterase [Methanoregulaceae archaeon]HPD09568.1 metallophosphoesterase [Methanoregulaceae archaeon]HRT15239.1 metallophosphoesterase [Methanoregulaceae archaeon]HRU30810.1 metallophosphoesterase [Methanoregulaceae archaeon]
MENVLLLADLHGEYGKLDAFLDLNPDAVFIAGDITNMGPAESATDLLSRIDVPAFAVPGNCDPRDMIEFLERSECVCLHSAHISLGKISIIGVGGSNPTPFNTPFELTDHQIDTILSAVIPKRREALHNVLISHAPPYGILDRARGNHVGSRSVLKHMPSFDLVCCAHIHEARGIAEREGVRIVNPGVAATGECALIHFGPEPKVIGIELITV